MPDTSKMSDSQCGGSDPAALLQRPVTMDDFFPPRAVTMDDFFPDGYACHASERLLGAVPLKSFPRAALPWAITILERLQREAQAKLELMHVVNFAVAAINATYYEGIPMHRWRLVQELLDSRPPQAKHETKTEENS